MSAAIQITNTKSSSSGAEELCYLELFFGGWLRGPECTETCEFKVGRTRRAVLWKQSSAPPHVAAPASGVLNKGLREADLHKENFHATYRVEWDLLHLTPRPNDLTSW